MEGAIQWEMGGEKGGTGKAPAFLKEKF